MKIFNYKALLLTLAVAIVAFTTLIMPDYAHAASAIRA